MISKRAYGLLGCVGCLGLLCGQQAHATLFALSVITPTYTPTCPARLVSVTGLAFTSVQGIADSALYSTVGVKGKFDTPSLTLSVPYGYAPVTLSSGGLVETPPLVDPNPVSGSYLMVATHEFLTIVGIPNVEYSNSYRFLPAN